MNSKAHFIISLVKSLLRIGGCVWLSVAFPFFIPFTFLWILAEIGGIAEEIFDRR